MPAALLWEPVAPPGLRDSAKWLTNLLEESPNLSRSPGGATGSHNSAAGMNRTKRWAING